ncbi:hypothetical protein [Mesobacillus foraminis]|uniref:Uncharacterized protein n=1 Tax=Mesobacillus foraminis TaxID=279826 RepID=A0A4R2BKM3_9BACI|nr:hypothetical protein [Mesobacillus foraminis]TCN27778.1 hypothetical protein EV146_101105 [Mesobacillus foraminis]
MLGPKEEQKGEGKIEKYYVPGSMKIRWRRKDREVLRTLFKEKQREKVR